MKKTFFVLIVFCAFFIFGFNVHAEDQIWAVFNKNKQNTLYYLSDTPQTIVLPSPNLPSVGQVTTPVGNASGYDEKNIINTKDIKIMTSHGFKDWLATNNIRAEAYNIKNIDDLYRRNWYFTIISDKPIISDYLKQAKAIDSTITKDNFFEKLSQITLDIYKNNDYNTYLKWRPFFQSLITANTKCNSGKLIGARKIKKLLINSVLPSTKTGFTRLLKDLTIEFNVPVAPSIQNYNNAKLELQAYFILSRNNNDKINTLAKFLTSGLDNFNPSDSVEIANDKFDKALYDAGKGDSYGTFRKAYMPMVALIKTVDNLDIGEDDFSKNFELIKYQTSIYTFEEFKKDAGIESVKELATRMAPDYLYDSSDEILFFRLDFNNDKPVYNYNRMAGYSIGSQDYYQGESNLLGDYSGDYTDETPKYKWSVFNSKAFAGLQMPYFFIKLDTKSLPKDEKYGYDMGRQEIQEANDKKRLLTSIKHYLGDTGFVKYEIPIDTEFVKNENSMNADGCKLRYRIVCLMAKPLIILCIIFLLVLAVIIWKRWK